MKNIARILVVTSIFLVLVAPIAWSYPTTLYDADSNGTHPENSTGTATIALEGTGNYYKDYSAEYLSGTDYQYTVPQFDYSSNRFRAYPIRYAQEKIDATKYVFSKAGGTYSPFNTYAKSGDKILSAEISTDPSVNYVTNWRYATSHSGAPYGDASLFYTYGTIADVADVTAGCTSSQPGRFSHSYQGPDGWFTRHTMELYTTWGVTLPLLPEDTPEYQLEIWWGGAITIGGTGSVPINTNWQIMFYNQLTGLYESHISSSLCPNDVGTTLNAQGFYTYGTSTDCNCICSDCSGTSDAQQFHYTFSGNQAYRYSVNGLVYFRTYQYYQYDSGMWWEYGFLTEQCDFMWARQKATGAKDLPHLNPSLGGVPNQVVLIEGNEPTEIVGGGNKWTIPDLLDGDYDYAVEVPFSSWFQSLSFTIGKWEGIYEKATSWYSGLNPIGLADLNGESMVRVEESMGSAGYFQYQIDDYDNDPNYIESPPETSPATGTFSFNVLWLQPEFLYCRFLIELEWDTLFAYWNDIPYSGDKPTLELNLAAQDFIEFSWSQGWVMEENLVRRVYVNSLQQTFGTTFVKYENDAPKYNTDFSIPSIYQHWSLFVPNIMYVQVWFDVSIPSLSSYTFPNPTGIYFEYSPITFSADASDLIGIDVVLLCFTDAFVGGERYYRQLGDVGSGHYQVEADLPRGNWSIWYLAQDNAGNWFASPSSRIDVIPSPIDVDSHNGTAIAFEKNIGFHQAHFNITGLGGDIYEILADDIVQEVGSWSGDTDVFYGIDWLGVGIHNVTLRARNTNDNWAQHQVDVDVYIAKPTIICVNGTSFDVDLGGLGDNIGFNITGANANAWELWVNTSMNPLEDVKVAEGTWISPESLILYNLDGLTEGIWNFTLYADTTYDFTNSYSAYVNCAKIPPRIMALNGSYVVASENADHIFRFKMIGSSPGAYNVTINGSVILEGLWVNGQIIEVIVNKPNGYYNISLNANNTNLMDASNITIFFAYHIPVFLQAPKSLWQFPEDSRIQQITFTLNDDNPLHYLLYVDNVLYQTGPVTNGSNAVEIYISSVDWSEGFYACNLSIYDAEGFSVNATFTIDVFPTLPQVTLHEDGRFFVGSTGNVLNWHIQDFALEGWKLFYVGEDEFGNPANITLDEGTFTSNNATISFSFDGIFAIGEYRIYFIAWDVHGRETGDSFLLLVEDNPPSVELNLNGLIAWIMVIGMFVVLTYGLKASKSRYWEDRKLRNSVLGFGVILVAILLTIFSFFGYLPVTSYRFMEWINTTQQNLGVYGIFILVGVSAGVAIGGYYLYRWVTQRISGEKEALG